MATKLVDADALEANLTSVADKIRAKTGGEETLAFPSGFVDALDTIESADSALAEVEYKLSNGYTNYSFYFAGLSIKEIPTEIIKFVENATGINAFCENCKYLIEFPSITLNDDVDIARCFYGCINLEKVGVLNGIARGIYMSFYNCQKLHTIQGLDISKSESVGSAFYKCTALENITFNGVIKATGLDLSPCSKLTHDSLMSAINALYDHKTAGSSGTFTLKLGSTNLAKLTDAEKAIATQKGWTLA